jgi:hypothetical protein
MICSLIDKFAFTNLIYSWTIFNDMIHESFIKVSLQDQMKFKNDLEQQYDQLSNETAQGLSEPMKVGIFVKPPKVPRT